MHIVSAAAVLSAAGLGLIVLGGLLLERGNGA